MARIIVMQSKKLDLAIITDVPEKVVWLKSQLQDLSVEIGGRELLMESKQSLLYYFSGILKPIEIVDRESKILNLHNSALPLFKGLHAFSWAIQEDISLLGYSLHLVTSDIDAGDLVSQLTFSLHTNCDVNCAFRIGKSLLKPWLPVILREYIGGSLQSFPQEYSLKLDSRLKGYFPRRSGPFDLKSPYTVKEARNAIRASNPPYGLGVICEQLPGKILCLQTSEESRYWIRAQKVRTRETLSCTDGPLEVICTEV